MSQGGKREGAGRKPAPDHLKRETCSVRLPRWLLEAVDEMEGSRGELVERALLKTYKLKEPKSG